jgi:hypothetical protein
MTISLLTATTLFSASANSPFLITGKMPHYTGVLMNHWDNKKLDLNEKQKEKLLKVRKNTIKTVKRLKKKLAPLEQKVANKILSGSTPNELLTTLQTIAKYKIKASTAHLKCVYKTQEILSKEQLNILNGLSK